MNLDTDPRCRTSLRWQQLLVPRGHRHELGAALVDDGGRCWGALSLLRDGDRAFDGSAANVVQRAATETAHRLSRAMVAGAARRSPESAASLWLGNDGEVLFATATATRCLDGLRTTGFLSRPEAVLAGLALRVAAANETPGAGRGPLSVRVRARDGAWTTLQAEPVRGSDEQNRGVGVVIEPSHPGAIFPLMADAYGLSDREQDVISGVLNGLDTKAISATLRISRYTVQDHLKSVFDKVGVRSRRELAHQLALQLL